MALLNLSRSSTIVLLLFIFLMLIAAFIPPSKAVSETLPTMQWGENYGVGQGNSIIQTADGGYALAGTYLGLEALLIKTDALGEVQWRRSYGTEVFGGSNNIVSLVQTRDLGYVLFGKGGYIVKTDVEGNVTWIKSLNMEGTKTGIQTIYEDYVLVGNREDTSGSNVVWIAKVDEEGNMLWGKEYTGGGYTVYAVTEAYDGGYVVAGSYTESFWLAKTDSNGSPQWDKKFSYGGLEDLHHATSLAKTSDGGYVVAGIGDWQASGGEVPWLIKTDSGGNEQWHRLFENVTSNGFVSVVQIEDGGYVAVQMSSATLVRTDKLGNLQWTASYGDTTGVYDHPSSLVRTKDGGFAVGGASSGSSRIWLIKISPEPISCQLQVSVFSPESKNYFTNRVSLRFTVSQATWMGYSLDGQDNVTISGNTTLTDLSEGSHSVTVYASDSSGNCGFSETIYFSIVNPLPVGLIVTIAVIGTAVGIGLLVYFKKLSLTRQTLVKIKDNNIVRTLSLITLCLLLILFQIFFPFLFYSSSTGSGDSNFQVGVSYVYEQDGIGQIYNEVAKIQALGFEVIRVNLVCDDTDPNGYANILTEEFSMAARHFNLSVALIINNDDDIDLVRYYLGRWGSYLSYIQVLNEPELSASWSVGALYTDDEIFSKFQDVYALVEPYRSSAQLYTNFEAGYLLRTNVPIILSEKLDFVGYDVYMESFLVLSPNFIQLLQETANKEVVISEFGASTINDAAQSDYIIQGLNLFRSMGLKGCWIAYWNSVNNNYGIRGRLAENTVGDWIAKNANSK